jgi:hypothetical protein
MQMQLRPAVFLVQAARAITSCRGNMRWQGEHVRTSSCAYMAVQSQGAAATAPPRARACIRGLKATAATSAEHRCSAVRFLTSEETISLVS